MHYFYIIYSRAIDRFYTGETHCISTRLEQHNTHAYKGSYTKSASDWEVKLSYSCEDRDSALYLEKFVKRMKSRKFMLKIIESSSILGDILNQR